MPAQPSKGPEIKIPKLGGIDLRSGRNALESGRCDRNFGLYPARTGAPSRMPGKKLWRVFEDGTTPRPVYQCKQAFSTGVIIQNGEAISIYTLDELRNRVQTYDITPTASDALAILAHYNSSASAGLVGNDPNTFYTTTGLQTITDAGAVVLSVSGGQFRLPLGVYRIDARVSFGSAGVTANSVRAGLYNVTNSAFQTYLGGTAEMLGTSGRLATQNGSNQNGSIFIKGRFQVTETSETFALSMALSASASSQIAQGAGASTVTGASSFYHIIKIYRE